MGANVSPTNGQATGTILDDHGPGIPTDLVLTDDTVTGTQSFLASNSIAARPHYQIRGDATFTAGTSVILRNGFSVATGATLKIEFDATLLPPTPWPTDGYGETR